MRSSIKASLTGLLTASALAFSAIGADAMGGNSNSADAFIGIVGGNPGTYVGGGSYNGGGFNQGGGYQAHTGNPFGHSYQNGQGGYGGYYHGY